MARYALLCGSAPDDFRQKKVAEMHDFLASKAGENIPEEHITIFPNGVSELVLECALSNLFDGVCAVADDEVGSGKDVEEITNVLLYFCTEKAVSDFEQSFWLGGEEIRRSVIAYYANLANECGIEMQLMWDSDSELVSEEILGYERVGNA